MQKTNLPRDGCIEFLFFSFFLFPATDERFSLAKIPASQFRWNGFADKNDL